MPPDSAIPGRYDWKITPYSWEIAEAVKSKKYKKVAALMASQMGKTLIGSNIIGQTYDETPKPIIYIAPTQKLVRDISSDEVRRMIQNTPSLKRKTTIDNVTEKWINGVPLRFAWGSSVNELSTYHAWCVIIDEVDRLRLDVGGEGNPIKLAEARVESYGDDSLILIISTPTIDGKSQIYTIWLSGTRLIWNWLCFGCEKYFAPKMKYLKWQAGVDKDTVYDEEAWVECPNCNYKIYEKEKYEINQNGIYINPKQEAFLRGGKLEIIGEPKESSTASFMINGLCSPFKTISDRASCFLEAKTEGIESIKTVINTRFGELFKETGEEITDDYINNATINYNNKLVPDNAFLLTSGVDVQKDCLYYVIRAWTANETSYLLEAKQIYGNTHKSPVWQKLSLVIERYIISNKGVPYPITMTAIDSGYETERVYAFCEKRIECTMACDGAKKLISPLPSPGVIETFPDGTKMKKGIKLWRYNKHYFRDWITTRMTYDEYEAEKWNIYAGAPQKYLTQITAEHKIEGATGYFFWEKKPGRKDNHFLDCEVLCRVAAHRLRIKDLSLAKPERQEQKIIQRNIHNDELY